MESSVNYARNSTTTAEKRLQRTAVIQGYKQPASHSDKIHLKDFCWQLKDNHINLGHHDLNPHSRAAKKKAGFTLQRL